MQLKRRQGPVLQECHSHLALCRPILHPHGGLTSANALRKLPKHPRAHASTAHWHLREELLLRSMRVRHADPAPLCLHAMRSDTHVQPLPPGVKGPQGFGLKLELLVSKVGSITTAPKRLRPQKVCSLSCDVHPPPLGRARVAKPHCVGLLLQLI